MPPKDDKTKFGAAVKQSTQRNFPTEEEVLQRMARPGGANYFQRNVPTVAQLEGIAVERFGTVPIEVQYAGDPAEIERQKTARRIEQRVTNMQIQMLNEEPAYRNAFSIEQTGEPMGFFGKTYNTLKFGYATMAGKEDIVEQELGFWEEEKRRVRNTLRFGEFLLSLGQDIPKALTGGIIAGFYQAGNNALRMATGEETQDVRWQSDSFWWKLLYGRETERDIYGRIIPGTEKGREVRSVTALQKDYQKALTEFQGIKPEDREFKDNIMPIMVSTFGAPTMMLLEMDIGILPIATVSKFVKGGIVTKRLTQGLLQGMETVIKSSGKAFDAVVAKEAAEIAKQVLKEKNPLKSQRLLNDFLLRTVGPESAEGKAIQGLEASINAEVASARTELDQIAAQAPDLPTFTNMIEAAIRSDRAQQATRIGNVLARTTNDPAFIEATQRVEQIFREFGTGLTDEEILKSQLRPDAPADVKQEFERLITKLSDINDNIINPRRRELSALSDAVPLGQGPFDVTRNLLRDTDKTLPNLLEDVFNAQQGRNTTAVRVINGTPLDAVTGNQIVDAFQKVNKELRIARMEGRGNGTAAMQRLADYLNAEDIARGGIARRTLAMAEEVAPVAAKTVAKKAPAVAKVKEVPVSPVNQKVFDNVNLSAGDTLLVAADDAASASSFEDFVANSGEVFYQGAGPNTYIKDINAAKAFNGNPEIMPPVVLDMRQPLRLVDEAATKNGIYRANDVGIRMADSFLGMMATPTDGILDIATATRLLDTARASGFDGLIYKQRINGKIVDARLAVAAKQAIPAQFFFDNIKGGKEIFGDGINLAVRRQQQPDDVLEKMLPKMKEYDQLAKKMVKDGVPEGVAKAAAREVHAFLLDNYVVTLNSSPRFITTRDFTATDGVENVSVAINKDGVVWGYNKPDGNRIVGRVMDRAEMITLYKQTAEAFNKDVKKRIKDLADVQVPGGITEGKFVAKGPGHKKFNDSLNQRIEEGVFLPEEALLIRRAFSDMDDNLLREIPSLKSSMEYVNRSLNGTYAPGTNQITMARGLSYQMLRKGMRSGTGMKSRDVGRLGSETFFHEFGHLGHKILLDDAQKKIVTAVYNSFTKDELLKIFGRDAGRTAMGRYYASSEDEFFAQAFAQYTLKNQLVDEALLPLFQRITLQLKNSLKSLFSRKNGVDSGKVDPLIPLFNQILRGQSSTRNLASRSKKAGDELMVYDKAPNNPSLNPEDNPISKKGVLLNRQAIEQNSKLIQALPGGFGVPDSVTKEAIGISRQVLADAANPPKTPKDVFQRGADPDTVYDAKVVRGINKIDPADPKLAASLQPQVIFGKNTKVSRSLRQGQTQLAKAMSAIQRSLVGKDTRFVKTVEALKANRDAALLRAKQRFETAESVKVELLKTMKYEAEAMAEFGTGFTAAQSKEIAGMIAKAKTQKNLEKALTKIFEMADERLRAEARDRIGKVLENVKTGSRSIPPFWQEKAEARVGVESIRLKLFREGYEERLKKLQAFLDEPGNADTKLEFRSAKTLRMLEDLEELKKRSVNDFGTGELMKLTYDLEKIYEQGEAAQFVIKGGKTKEIATWSVKVDPNTGAVTKVKDVKQKGGVAVMGLEELRIKARVSVVEDAASAGKINNMDSGQVMQKYGDLDAATFSGIWDGIKGLAKGDRNAWNRGLMTFLTSDRTVNLMDKMDPNGVIYKTMLKPIRDAVNKGERAGNLARTNLILKERELIKKHNLVFGREAEELGYEGAARLGSKILSAGFSDANYQRIAIWAYHQQGLSRKLENVVPRADIDDVVKGGLKPYEKEMYEYMREELDKLYPKVDGVMRDEYGQRIERIENYFPIQTNVLDNRTMGEVLSIEYIPNKRAVARGFTKERFDMANGMMQMNARDIFTKHMRDVNYFVEVEPTLKQVSGMARDEGFRKAVGDNSGLWWEQYLDIVSRRGTPKNYDFNWSDTARKNLGAATLGLNPSPVVKQWLAAFAGLGLVGPKHTLLNGHSLMMKHKLFDAIGDVSIEQALRAADDPAYVELRASGKIQAYQDMGYWAIKKTDAYTARGIWLAAYSKQLEKKGIRLDVENFKNGIGIDQEALDYADMIVRKTQGSGKFQDLPMMLTNKDKRLFTFLFQFQSFVLSQSQLLTHDAFYSVYASARGKSAIPLKDATGTAFTITGAITAATFFEQEITKVLTSLYGSENAKAFQEENSGTGERIKQGIYSAFPPLGTAMGFVDEDINTNVPVIDKILLGGVSISRALNADTETLSGRETQAKESLRAVAAAITLGLGLPGTSFTQQIIQNKGIEPSFRSPAENLKYAILAGDKAEVRLLIKKYQEQGLDVNEISMKVERMIKSDQKAQRKKDVETLVRAFKTANTPAERNDLREKIKAGIKDGTLTEEHFKDMEEALKKKKRLQDIGEI